MKPTRLARVLELILVVAFALAVPGEALASSTANAAAPSSAAVAFFPPDAPVGGLDLADWTARFQQWLLSFPSSVSPAFDLTGERCAYGQSGPVFFLLQSPAEYGMVSTPQSVTRRCAVPRGTALYVPVLQDECSTAEAPPFFGRTETALRACVSGLINRKPPHDLPKMAVTVDGQSAGDITWRRAMTRLCTLILPPDNIAGVPATVANSEVDGYQLLLAPLAAGNHVITITTPYAGGVHTVTYQLTVAAAAS